MNRRRLGEGFIYYAFVIVGWVAYAALSLRAPSDVARSLYNLSSLQLIEIQLSFMVPLLVIWLFAAYGTAWLKRYALMLGNAPEGKAFRNLADGVFVLLAGLVAQSIIGTARSYFQDTTAIRQIVIEINYIQVTFGIIAFALLYVGSKRLLGLVEKKPSLTARGLWVVPVAAVSAVYVWATLHNPNRTLPISSSTSATFYLSDRMIIGTIIIPYIVIWLIGAAACYNLYYFAKHIKGIVYRRSLSRMAIGLIGVLVLSIVIQLIGSVGAELLRWSLGQLLLLFYVLVALMAIGYIYIAIGASRLARIEEA